VSSPAFNSGEVGPRPSRRNKAKRSVLNFGMSNRAICIQRGTSGVGRAAARVLAGEGARIAVIGQTARSVDGTIAELKALGADATGCPLDVRDAKATLAAIARFEDDIGAIEGLVLSGSALAGTLDEQAWSDVLSVNLTGTFLTCQTVGARVISRRRERSW
jgi:NAD(P)-dependent dehydrogenase (short-subunit alcohol dehydrogenase family)